MKRGNNTSNTNNTNNNITMTKGGRNVDTLQWHDLVSPEPIKDLPIPLPEKIEAESDRTQLFHWLVSYYCITINIFEKRFGYEERQVMLAGLLNVVKNGIPQETPEYISNYPNSLEDIEYLVGRMILVSTEFAEVRQYSKGDISELEEITENTES